MTNKYYSDGKKYDLTCTSAVTHSTIWSGTDLHGVYLESGVTGDVVAVALEGVFDLAKTTVATTVGQRVYVSSGNITTTATGDQVGYALEATATGDANVRVKLWPSDT